MNIFAYCCNNPINDTDYDGYYSASKAKAYAEKWWNTSKNGYNNKYGKNPAKGDCTNFVSACLYEGGLSKMTGTLKWGWHCYLNKNVNVNGRPYYTYDRSHAWAAAQNLYDWLHSSKHTSYTYVIKKASDVNDVGRVLYKKSICAAAIFFDDDHDYNKNHAALSGVITKTKNNYYNIYYYAHSGDRSGKVADKTSIRYYLKTHSGGIVYVCLLK